MSPLTQISFSRYFIRGSLCLREAHVMLSSMVPGREQWPVNRPTKCS
jgi:hypothetical protein